MDLQTDHSRFFIISMAVISLLCAVLFYAGYWLGKAHNPVYAGKLNGVGTNKTRIAELKRKTQTSLRRLSLYVGYMKARVIRLNEYGKRMTKLSKIDAKDFNFSMNPGIGGLENKVKGKISSKSLIEEINQLSAVLKDRELKLSILEILLIEAKLKRSTFPEGKPVRKSDGWIKMTSTFGMRIHPIKRRRIFHDGIDYAGKRGAPIYTVAAGIVTASGWRGGYGYTVDVFHGNGLVSRYAHNKKLLVKVGDKISKGQKIALLGSTGRSTGPHVHYEILKDGKPVSPHSFINKNKPVK